MGGRDYRKTGRDLLADDLDYLIRRWRTASWFQRPNIAKAIAAKVSANSDTITETLRGGEGK